MFSCAAQNPDIDLLKEINLHRYTAMDFFFQAITDSEMWIAYSLPPLILFYALYKGNLLLRRKAVFMTVSMLLAVTVCTILKHAVHRPRPFITYHFLQKMTSIASASFPSGHTTDAFAFAASLSFAFRKRTVIIPAFLWACLVGYSRMDLGVHYPSDVLGGIVIGIVCPWAIYLLMHRKRFHLTNVTF